MPISPAEMEILLVSLCQFQIESADLAREIAPWRSLEAAKYKHACAEAALSTLRQAVMLRDREVARTPLRSTAERLGVSLDEADYDFARRAMRALEVMIEAGEENLRRDRGIQGAAPRYLPSALRAIGAQGNPAAGLAALGLQSTPPAAPSAGVTDPVVSPAGQVPEPPARPAPPIDVDAHTGSRPHPRPAARKPAAGAAKAKTRPTRAKASATTLRAVGEHYVDLRCQGYRSFKCTETLSETGGVSWKKNSSTNVRSTINLLEKGLPVSDLAEVTEEMLTDFWSQVTRLPRSYADKTSDNRDLRQIVEDTEMQDAKTEALTRARLEKEGASPGKIEFQVLIGRIPRIRAATVYRHMQDAQRICRSAVAKGYLDANTMADHIWEKSEYDRRELLQEDNKREAWFDDLPKLLRTHTFQQPVDDSGEPLFWAPLIALHSGFRSEEILRLATNDIRDVEGIPCFVLQKGVGQSLKSAVARRTVPVHQNLIDLGLLQLVTERQRAGEPRLFPWLERSQAKKTYTESFSKTFTVYRKTEGIYRPGLDFHAFRTTFNQALVANSCQESERRYLLGHAEHDIGIVHYAPDGFAMPTLRDRVNAVSYDLSMVRRPFEARGTSTVCDLAAHRRNRQTG